MVTGDSQEEVIIFRDKQTHMHHNIYIITTTTTTNSKEFLDFYSISWRFVSPTVTIECKSDTEIFDDFSENLKPADFLFLAVVFVVFCLDVYFFRYG